MSSEKKIYECGTLKYSLSGVILTIGLLMLGFFSMRFSANIVGLVSLRLKFLQASDMTLAFIMSTIGGVFNMVVCPTVSFKSDRYRGKRWGRRIVFIIGTLPMMCLSMLGFAASGPAGDFLASVLKPLGEFAPATITILIIGIVMVFYQFFYMFVGSVIYYIYNDVIPTQFLARAVGMVQVAGTAAATVFNFFFFKHANTHFAWLLILGAVVYFLGVGAMCLFIKEPKLPPLTEEEKSQSRGFSGIFTFMKESFSHRFYWYNTLASTFWSVGIGVIGTFLVFYYMSLGMTLEDIGKLNGISGLVGLFIGLGMAAAGAFLIDRWHPVRVNIYTVLYHSILVLVFGKWIFCSPGTNVVFAVMLASLIVNMVVSNISGLAGMPMLIRTLPKSRFGQFCSANAMVRSLFVLAGGLLLGVCIDVARKIIGGDYFVYRLIWVWRFIFGGIGMVFYLLTYREYLKLGGELNFKAPAPWSPEKWEQLDNTPSCGITRNALKLAVYSWDALIGIYALFTVGALLYCKSFTFGIWSLPVMAVTVIAWLLLRLSIWSRMPVIGEKVYGGVIHPGILAIGALVQALLLVCGVIQTIMLFKESIFVCSYMWGIEIFILLVDIALLWIGNRIERTVPEETDN